MIKEAGSILKKSRNSLSSYQGEPRNYYVTSAQNQFYWWHSNFPWNEIKLCQTQKMNCRNSKERTRSNLRIFGGSSHPNLTKTIARRVGVQVGEIKLTKFANNETNVDLKENVRGQVSFGRQTAENRIIANCKRWELLVGKWHKIAASSYIFSTILILWL